MKLKEITENSWLVEKNHDVGLISRKNSGGYLLILNQQAQEFPDRQALEEHFQENVFGDIELSPEIQHDTQYRVRGYPVSYPQPVPVDQEHALPLFAKRPGTDVVFCAGHYAMCTPKGWRGVFCPKLSTLEQYPFLGPFRTRKRMQQAMKKTKSHE